MNIVISADPRTLGHSAAEQTAALLREAILKKGAARLILSTGASQLTTIESLVRQNVEWDKVEMFHLDEYVGLPDTHAASFRKYLRERFINIVNPKHAYLVDGSARSIPALTQALRSAPVDVGLIGIGENAHIAFNDPPADFNTRDAYIVVNLNDECKKQQVREGWFANVDDVPKQAVSMTVYQILQCENILSCVPFAVKTRAVKLTLENDKTNLIPATALKSHPHFTLYVDRDSYSTVDESRIRPGEKQPVAVRHEMD